MLLIAGLVAMLGVTPAWPQAVESAIEDAGAFLKAGKSADAVRRLQTLEPGASGADEARVKNALGYTLYSAGRSGDAVPLLREAQDLAAEGDDTETLVKASNNLGLVEFTRGNLAAARSAFERAAAHDSELARDYLAIIARQELAGKVAASTAEGVAAVHTKRYDEAITSYDAALALDPDNARVLSLRGYARLRGGDAAAAVDDLARAVEIDPEAPFARLNLLKARCVESNAQPPIELAPQSESERATYLSDGELRRLCGARLAALLE